MRTNTETFENVQPVLHAKVPIIRSRHRRLHIEIDISLHNMLVNIINSNIFLYMKFLRLLKILGY
jgi:hypothetical protein